MTYEETSIFDVSQSSAETSRARSIASLSDAATSVVHWMRVTVNSGIELLQNLSLCISWRVGLDRFRETREARGVGIIVDHRDVALGDPGDHQFVIDPHANDRVSRHGGEHDTAHRQALAQAWAEGARDGSRGLLPATERDRRNPYIMHTSTCTCAYCYSAAMGGGK